MMAPDSSGYLFVNLNRSSLPKARRDCESITNHTKVTAAISVKSPLAQAAISFPSPLHITMESEGHD